MEDHYDDCGEDLSSLLLMDAASTEAPDSDNESLDIDDLLEQEWSDEWGDPLYEASHFNNLFYGSTAQEIYSDPPDTQLYMTNPSALLAYLKDKPSAGEQIDVIELFGGVGGILKACIKRRMKTGQNFDLVLGVDLSKSNEVAQLWEYVLTYKPKVVVMAPPCTAFGSWSHWCAP